MLLLLLLLFSRRKVNESFVLLSDIRCRLLFKVFVDARRKKKECLRTRVSLENDGSSLSLRTVRFGPILGLPDFSARKSLVRTSACYCYNTPSW